MAKSNKGMLKEIASERIGILYGIARNEFVGNGDARLATRHVKLMRKISMHYKVKLPKAIKYGVCKKCNYVLVQGKNCTVRVVGKKKVSITTCTNCNATMLAPLRP